jgi:DNA-binding PadR family transcriptional regulator
MTNERLKGHLDLLLLRVVADRPAHGYEIVCALRERSNGTFDLPEGTVYPALHRLERQGALISDWDDSAGRRRRVYRISERGEAALARQLSEWQEFSGGVSRIVEAKA